MTPIRNSLIGLCVVAASMSAMAQNADEHKDHHPAGTATPAASAKKAPAKSVNADKMASMDQRMKDMHAMHEKMMSAKTPEERQALMPEHMKMMQDGMGMMKQMGGMHAGKDMSANMADRQQMMEKRMDMMESMMQMMMDRTPGAPTK